MNKRYYFLYLLFLNIYLLRAQGWEKVYNGIYSDINSMWEPTTQKVAVTSDGGFILAGYKYDSTLTYAQMHLIKTDASGNIVWNQGYSCNKNAIPEAVIETPGGYWVGGTKYSPEVACLLKLDRSGNLINSIEYDSAQSIELICPSNNGLLLLGSRSNGIYLSQVDSNGTIVWAKTWNLANLSPQALIPAAQNGFVLVAKRASITYGIGDVCEVVRLDSLGAVIWSKSYSYYDGYDVHAIAETATGDLILGGNVLMRLDNSGNIKWSKGWPLGLIQDIKNEPNGDVVALTSTSNANGISLVRITSQGVIKWQQDFGGDQDQAGNLIVTPGNEFLLSGYYNDYASHINGFYLIKTDSLGQSGCNIHPRKDPPYQPHYYLCTVNSNSCVFSGGSASSNAGFTQFFEPLASIDPCCYAKSKINLDGYYVCYGDTIEYSGSGAPYFHWSTGDTTSVIRTKDTLVWLQAINTCGSFYDTMIVHPGFVPTYSCTLNKNSICRGDSVHLYLAGNAPYYNCGGEGVIKISATQYYLKPTSSTSYTVDGYTGYYGPGCSNIQTFSINVTPNKPFITQHSDTLVSSSLYNNQWTSNGSDIPGATSQVFIPPSSGFYSVRVTSGSCSNASEGLAYVPDSVKYTRNAWQRIITGGQGWGETGAAIAEAHGGGFMIVSHEHEQTISEDIVLIKTDSTGNVVWSRKISGAGAEHLNSLIRVTGGYIATGSTTTFGSGGKDLLLIAFDMNGQVLWSRSYGDWNDQVGRCVEQTADGGYIITGSTTDPYSFTVDPWGFPADEIDVLAIKTDDNGNLVWSKVFDAGHREEGVEVIQDAVGNYVIAADYTDTQGKSGAYILKLDANGSLVWSQVINSAFFVWPSAMARLPDDTYMVCGGTSGNTNLMKVDAGGNVMWSKTAQVGTWGNSMALTKDSNVVFTSGGCFTKATLSKIDMNGNVIWSSKFGDGTEYISKVLALASGSFLMTGGINVTNSFYDAATQHLNLIYANEYGATNCNDTLNPLITNETYTYCPHTTTTFNLGSQSNGALNQASIAYAASSVCKPVTKTYVTSIASDHPLTFKVYPNPSQGLIYVECPGKTIARLRVLDICGKCVRDEMIHSQEVWKIDLSCAGAGIYFVEVSQGDVKNVSKIILARQ